MVHREGQMQRLFSLLRPIVEAGASSNAFLYGPVGTGKTHTAKRFCLDFKKYASESDRAVDWDLVNCRQRMGDDAILLRLIQHFDAHFPERGFSIAEKMETLRRHLEKHRLHFIVILDEVDALLKKSGADLIYSFARIAEETIASKGNISMILISQRPNALEYMDRAALSTFRRRMSKSASVSSMSRRNSCSWQSPGRAARKRTSRWATPKRHIPSCAKSTTRSRGPTPSSGSMCAISMRSASSTRS